MDATKLYINLLGISCMISFTVQINIDMRFSLPFLVNQEMEFVNKQNSD